VFQQALHFVAQQDAEVFGHAPAAPAVFALHGDGGEPYVSKTANLRRRLMRLLGIPDSSRRLNLRERVMRIEWTETGSDFESGLLLYAALRLEFPRTYAARLRWRPAHLIRLILENDYPRAMVTTRITTLRRRSLYYGPFPARSLAEKFLNDSLDLFKLRRCTDDLAPDAAFPGCIYSEMKMCLAPCFRGCSESDYHAEVERVQQWLDTGGQSLVRELAAERDRASSALEFEKAAATHLRWEKAATAASNLDEIVRRIDRLNGVVVQPSALPDHVALFRLEGGRLSGPVQFAIEQQSAEHTAKPRSMESRVIEALTAIPELPAGTAQETLEHLAYLKRWYYRSAKPGELFLADLRGELPLRRVVRGISRVFRGEPSAGEPSETAHDYWINRGRAAQLNPDNYNL